MGQGLESAPAQPSTPATPELPPPPTTNGVESTALAALSSPPPATSKPKSSPTPLPQKSVITRSEAPTTPPMSSPGGTAASSLPGHSPTAAGVEERGVRCNLTDCNKLFRSENLLLQHVKVLNRDFLLNQQQKSTWLIIEGWLYIIIERRLEFQAHLIQHKNNVLLDAK